MLKTAAQLVALLATLGGGLYTFDAVYVRHTEFSYFKANYYQDQADQIQRKIWDYGDRVKKDPQNKDLKERIRELELQKKRAEENARGKK
jgi:hypothetical protein